MSGKDLKENQTNMKNMVCIYFLIYEKIARGTLGSGKSPEDYHWSSRV